MATGLFTLKQVNQAVRQTAWTTGVKTTAVDYLVVAGGGGAGAGDPGGGGAGGLLQGSVPVVTGSAITVTVGAGGAGRSGATVPGSGTASVFGSLSAVGGGYGATSSTPGGSGGSGGGAGTSTASVFGQIGQGTFNQGNPGGIGSTSAGGQAGGGGGAGTRGGYNSNGAGDGGTGVASAISGTVTAYAGGGGGSGSGTSGRGGAGGGGAGATGTNGTSGTANTGGGGGGANSYTGGSGGSGIVVVSYPDTFAAAASTTGSPTVSTSGSGSLSYPGGTGTNLYWNNNNSNTTTSNFTLEGWFNPNVVSGATNIIRGYNQFSIAILIDAGVLKFYLSQSGAGSWNIASNVGTGSVSTSTWYHFALVRNSSTFTMYLNGVASGTATSSLSVENTAGLNIGAEQNGTAAGVFNGYITNVRMVVGTAVYTANFTPPTAPLTAITNTTFLLGVNSGARYLDSSGLSNTPILVGTPTWNALSPFSVTGYKNRTYTWTSSGTITF